MIFKNIMTDGGYICILDILDASELCKLSQSLICNLYF